MTETVLHLRAKDATNMDRGGTAARAPEDQGMFPSPGHNHQPCLAAARSRAEQAFAACQLRMTDLRRQVFEEIAASHQAIGAYEVLERLANKGTRLAPISVYRAIDALLKAGIVHRLESRNAYFACHAEHNNGNTSVVMTCEDCGLTAELPNSKVHQAIVAATAEAGFMTHAAVVEVIGRCGHCG